MDEMKLSDIFELFKERFPDAAVEDWRPICHELFVKYRSGATIFLENGDILEYYPKEGEREV